LLARAPARVDERGRQAMVVGMCRVVLALPWNDSLKGKRSVVKSVVERARAKYHVAAAEVGDLDQHRRATLGFAVVSNDARHARSLLDKLVGFVAGASEAQLIDHAISIEHFELGAGQPFAVGDADDEDAWEDEEEDGDEEES
jgi:uncharacterized protein YlxP (DUF503 family)